MYITILNLFQLMIDKHFAVGYLLSSDDVIMQISSWSCLHCLGCLNLALNSFELSAALIYYSHCHQLIPHVHVRRPLQCNLFWPPFAFQLLITYFFFNMLLIERLRNSLFSSFLGIVSGRSSTAKSANAKEELKCSSSKPTQLFLSPFDLKKAAWALLWFTGGGALK